MMPGASQSQTRTDEDELLGCILAGADPTGLGVLPEHFWEPHNERIFRGCLAVAEAGNRCDPQGVRLAMGDEVNRLPGGGALRLVNLAHDATPVYAPEYAAKVREAHAHRRTSEALTRATMLHDSGATRDEIAAALEPALKTEDTGRFRFKGAGSFILDCSDRPTAVWGEGNTLLAAEGEATLLAGVQGCGKSTVAQQFALGRAGFAEYATLLDLPIIPGNRRVLYLAMDRPKQIGRSLRRMVGEAWRAELDERIAIWEGPPEKDLAKHPGELKAMAIAAGADTVIVDSLKDAAVGLSDDEVGAGWNRARQTCLTAGIELLELHHGRKAQNGTKRDKLTLDDVYGSTWITSGAGSVLILSGDPGDPIVSLHHVKQPADEVGPYQLAHDHAAGRTAIWHASDLVEVARVRGGLTAVDAAEVMFETDKPTSAQREKARRKLVSLTSKGMLRLLDEGDKTANRPAFWGVS